MKSEKESRALFTYRILFGLSLFLAHGLPKFHMLGTNLVNSFPDPLGFGSAVSFYGNIFAELICSLLIVLGLFTRFAALVISFSMAVAAFKFHAHDPYTAQFITEFAPKYPLLFTPFKEWSLLYLYAFAPMIFLGGGSWSLDGLIRNKRQ